VNILQGSEFLNDRLISFFFAYLAHEKFQDLRDSVLLIPPDMAMMLRFVSLEEINLFFGSLKPGSCDMVGCFT
jgi:hypothetical protein